MRRRSYRAAVVAGVLLLVGGVTLAVLGYTEDGGPAGAVRSYFAALARGDAPGALALGDLPDGPHALLTSTALRAQQRIAPIRHFSVTGTRRSGRAATVSVRYVLAFAGSPQTVDGRVPVHDTGNGWRLDRTAVATSLDLDRAADRATIPGGGHPSGDVLLFPGAVPIAFDTPYLRVTAAQDSVGFGSRTSTVVGVEISPAGQRAVLAALQARLGKCLAGPADPTCPLPDERFVPGTVRGRLSGSLADHVRIRLGDGDAGVLEIDGTQPVAATSYRRLGFDNRARTGSGRVVLVIGARAYAVAPLRLEWRSP